MGSRVDVQRCRSEVGDSCRKIRETRGDGLEARLLKEEGTREQEIRQTRRSVDDFVS